MGKGLIKPIKEKLKRGELPSSYLVSDVRRKMFFYGNTLYYNMPIISRC